jgi:hypothetical protein
MNLLLKETRISKNLYNIIYRYSDNSFKTLYKIYDENILFLNDFMSTITLKDLFVQSVNLNRSGFWVLKKHKNIINSVDKMIIKENAEKYIVKIKQQYTVLYNFKNKKLHSGPIYRLNCWTHTIKN